MGHPIHKHMGGMKSAERFDAKEAYNKKLSSKARMHYLENDIADKKGSPARMEGGRKDHKMSNSEYSAHLQSPKGKKEHGAGMSRHTSEHSTEEYMDRKDAAIKKAKGVSRKSSPANNINYGTGYIGEQRADDMKYNPVDDRAGMPRYKKDY